MGRQTRDALRACTAGGSAVKIAHVLQWFELGGGESVALRLAGRQREAGHDVQALAFAGGPLQQRFEREGIPTQVLPKRAGFDPLLYVRVLAVCLTRALLGRAYARSAIAGLRGGTGTGQRGKRSFTPSTVTRWKAPGAWCCGEWPRPSCTPSSPYPRPPRKPPGITAR